MKVVICLAAGAVAAVLAGGQPDERSRVAPANRLDAFDPTHIQAIVVEKNETDPASLKAVCGLGANTLVTHANPDIATARAARELNLFYIARMTTQDVAQTATDMDYAARLRAVEGLSGVYYEDDEAPEGYASPQTQQSAYDSLKVLFPGALILHPTRLDPIASDPTYLNEFFRPQFTDLVTPYF